MGLESAPVTTGFDSHKGARHASYHRFRLTDSQKQAWQIASELTTGTCPMGIPENVKYPRKYSSRIER